MKGPAALDRITSAVRNLDPKMRLRLAIGGAALVGIVLFATCGGCGNGRPPPNATVIVSADGGVMVVGSARAPLDAAALRDPLLWSHAKSGEAEDLASLAAHEGAMGLVEATNDPELRVTAIRAMAYARGWAQLPLLARVAAAKDDEEARLALDAAIDLAARPRRSEETEDEPELSDACEAFGALARDATRPRARRVASIRALRMLPCPPSKSDLPTDVDTK